MRLPVVARFFTHDFEDMAEGAVHSGEAKSQPKDARYRCPEHKVDWFKRGNMKGYAHPLTDSGGKTVGWCNMADFKLDDTARGEPVEPQGTPPVSQEAPSGPVTVKDWGECYTQAHKLWGMTPKSFHDILGKSQQEWTSTAQAAFDMVAASKAEAERMR